MRENDLPLFAWQPPKQVLLFPLTRRVGKVRQTAGKLLHKHGDDADLYWKQVLAANRKHLERVGLLPHEVDEQLRAFFDAVQGEVNRLAYERVSRGDFPGGAA